MDLASNTTNLSLNKFNKCGELYRSPIINNKQYMFLSCIFCKDISWDVEKFLQHLDNTHQPNDNICGNMYKEEKSKVQHLIRSETNIDLKIIHSRSKSSSPVNSENDPLDEKHYDYNELLPVTNKMKKSVSVESNTDNLITEYQSATKNSENITDLLEINSFEDEDSSDEDYEPDKIATDDESFGNNGEYRNEEFYEEDDENDYTDDTVYRPKINECNKTNLKGLSKNREFIKAIIKAFQKQSVLWESSFKTIRSTSPEKQEALTKILKEINEKYSISATLEQIKLIIKRLKIRFVRHLRLREKGESNKTLWFYDLLTFLEPHLKDKKATTGICKLLDDEKLVTLIKLLKENECFWNENNIYHTSVFKKQEILKTITNHFSEICEFKDFNVDIMQNSLDEIIEMAREENASKMKHNTNGENKKYQSNNKFFKEIQFLLPHVGPFKCRYCRKTFTDIYAFKLHISTHEGTKPFKCMECPREMTYKKEFVCHLRRHTNEFPFQCNACDKSFPSQKEWHRHVIKHGSKPYVCELCADSFYTQHQLTNHMKNHNNIRDHVCPECGKGFTHRGLLRQHLQTHNKTKCFCPLCDNIYSNPRSLRKHYVRVHESGKQPSAASMAQYNCQICKITFNTIQDAKQHRKEHKQSNPPERKHICDICGHNFAYPRNLADHKKTHSNIRDQVCDVCGKGFTNTNLLNQHRNVHKGEKFVCKACGKDYAHYRGLCRHITKVHDTNIRDLDALLQKQNRVSSQ